MATTASPDNKTAVLSRYPTSEPVLNALPTQGAASSKEGKDKSPQPKADAAPKKKEKS